MDTHTAPKITSSLPSSSTSLLNSVTKEKRMTFFTSRMNALTTLRQKPVP